MKLTRGREGRQRSARADRQRNARLRAVLAQIHSGARTRQGIVLDEEGAKVVHPKTGDRVRLSAKLQRTIERLCALRKAPSVRQRRETDRAVPRPQANRRSVRAAAAATLAMTEAFRSASV